VQLDGSSTEIYIKFHKHPYSPEERVRAKAQLEYETLRRLSEAFASIPGCSVARPIAYFSEYKAVVTEKADGKNLHTLLNRPLRSLLRIDAKKGMEWCYQAGRWLRKFQEVTKRPEKEKFASESFRGEVEGLAKRCGTLGFSPLSARRILSWARSELERVGEPELQVVGQHPDFQPQNILVTSNGITVLDFTSFKYGNRYHDVACFLTFLDSRLKHPLFSKAQIHRLREGFLRGLRLLSLEDPLLRLYRAKEMLNYLATFLERIVGSDGSWPIMRRLFLRWAERQAIEGLVK
jgi:aminoglycoside phosphotransferase (APT) family kinase protein